MPIIYFISIFSIIMQLLISIVYYSHELIIYPVKFCLVDLVMFMNYLFTIKICKISRSMIIRNTIFSYWGFAPIIFSVTAVFVQLSWLWVLIFILCVTLYDGIIFKLHFKETRNS
jgi:hypothetical protein